jgi:hypothetical protein
VIIHPDTPRRTAHGRVSELALLRLDQTFAYTVRQARAQLVDPDN